MLSGIPLFPVQASTIASAVDNLYFFILAVTAFFALLVVVLVVYFAVKYRDDTGLKAVTGADGSYRIVLPAAAGDPWYSAAAATATVATWAGRGTVGSVAP